jgi:hypothetical protein
VRSARQSIAVSTPIAVVADKNSQTFLGTATLPPGREVQFMLPRKKITLVEHVGTQTSNTPQFYSAPFGSVGEGFLAGVSAVQQMSPWTFNPYILQTTSRMSRAPTAPVLSIAEGRPVPPRTLLVVPRLIQAALSPTRTPWRIAIPKMKQP